MEKASTLKFLTKQQQQQQQQQKKKKKKKERKKTERTFLTYLLSHYIP